MSKGLSHPGQDTHKDNQVADNSIAGHDSRDTDTNGRVDTDQDTSLARHAFEHAKTDGKKGHNTGASKPEQVDRDKGTAGQSKRDTQMDGQVDGQTASTRRENFDKISTTNSHSTKSGKRKIMELRRRSKIKVCIISVYFVVPCLCGYFKVTGSIDK